VEEIGKEERGEGKGIRGRGRKSRKDRGRGRKGTTGVKEGWGRGKRREEAGNKGRI